LFLLFRAASIKELPSDDHAPIVRLCH